MVRRTVGATGAGVMWMLDAAQGMPFHAPATVSLGGTGHEAMGCDSGASGASSSASGGPWRKIRPTKPVGAFSVWSNRKHVIFSGGSKKSVMSWGDRLISAFLKPTSSPPGSQKSTSSSETDDDFCGLGNSAGIFMDVQQKWTTITSYYIKNVMGNDFCGLVFDVHPFISPNTMM